MVMTKPKSGKKAAKTRKKVDQNVETRVVAQSLNVQIDMELLFPGVDEKTLQKLLPKKIEQIRDLLVFDFKLDGSVRGKLQGVALENVEIYWGSDPDLVDYEEDILD